MSDPDAGFSDRSRQRQMALQRWENEGGAVPRGLRTDLTPGGPQCPGSPLSDAELLQLQIRVIALENLVIALLAQASETALDLARAMAAYISPRPGFTPHRQTIHAAAEMISLVGRARKFRTIPPE